MVEKLSNILKVNNNELIDKVKTLINHRKACKWKKIIQRFREIMKTSGENHFSRKDIIK